MLYLFLGYGVLFTLLFLYMLRLGRQIDELERSVANLESRRTSGQHQA